MSLCLRHHEGTSKIPIYSESSLILSSNFRDSLCIFVYKRMSYCLIIYPINDVFLHFLWDKCKWPTKLYELYLDWISKLTFTENWIGIVLIAKSLYWPISNVLSCSMAFNVRYHTVQEVNSCKYGRSLVWLLFKQFL